MSHRLQLAIRSGITPVELMSRNAGYAYECEAVSLSASE